MKWIVVGVVVALLIAVLVWVTSVSSTRELPDSGEVISIQTEKVMTGEVVSDSVQKKQPRVKIAEKYTDEDLDISDVSTSHVVTATDEPVTSHSIESALDSMRDGLAEGDSRTPELSDPLEYEQPTLDELSDPVMYQQYEKRQSLNQASAYFSAAIKELPVLRAKIAQARQNGTQTEEELQEAEEALQKLELMQLEYKWQMPEASKADTPEE